MNYLDAVILGIVEGLTEFLPVSSTGHLTIAEKLLGLPIDDKGVTAFTAVIQMGAIVAVILYFRRDILRIAVAWVRGLVKPEYRGHLDHRFGWYVIVGTIPVGIIGFLGKDVISGPLRSLWVVAFALILWSFVMIAAERVATQARSERDVSLLDSIVIGLVQCFALIPGVSRSGATISAGLFRGLDRVSRDPDELLPRPSPRCWRRASSSSRTRCTAASASGPPPSARWSASSSPTRRSPGCSGSSRATRSPGSCPTASSSG